MPRRPRRWPGRLALLFLVPSLLVLLLEGILALAGVAPRPTYFERAEENGVEMFVAGEDPALPRSEFRVERFPVHKAPGTVRIVCLGGSSTFGHPFLPPGPFSDWLAIRLPVLLPNRRFEVLNLGCNGWNSEAVRDLVVELGDAEPDLLIVYSGHNEFMVRNLPQVRQPRLHDLRRRLLGTHLGRLLDRWISLRTPLGQVEAQLREGTTIHDQPLVSAAGLARGHARYRRNLGELVAFAAERDIPVLLCHPVADLRDTPVEYSVFSPDTPAAARDDFRVRLRKLQRRRHALEEQRRDRPDADLSEGLAECETLLAELEAIDPAVAQLRYERGRLLLLRGQVEEAWPLFQEALDRDGHPIRATREIHDVLDQLARQENVTIADPRPLFVAAADPDPVPGEDGLMMSAPELFVDYCHPNLEGHRLLAEAMLRALARGGVLAPPEDWRFDDEPSDDEYRERMGFDPRAQAMSFVNRALFGLGRFYFTEGSGGVNMAASLLGVAVECDPDCALAHAGLGVVCAIRRDRDGVLARFDRAEALDPAETRDFIEKLEAQSTVVELFAELGLTFEDGELRR